MKLSPPVSLPLLLLVAGAMGCGHADYDGFAGTVMEGSVPEAFTAVFAPYLAGAVADSSVQTDLAVLEASAGPLPDRAAALAAPRPGRYVLDADTGNEIDDLYAIAYALGETGSGAELRALTAAQWFHEYSGDSTMYVSQRLNEELVALAGKTGAVDAVPGADSAMGAPWGGFDPRDSPAARRIIAEADALPSGERLAVVCLGATTNVASALALAPRIRDHIAVWALGYRYDAEARVWDKDEFNIRRDLNAANYLLNAAGLELHVMPITVAIHYTWDRDSTFAHLADAGDVGAYLRRRWETHATGDQRRTMWDVALLQAFLDPSLAEEARRAVPPENGERAVSVYGAVDTVGMARTYWSVVATGGGD